MGGDNTWMGGGGVPRPPIVDNPDFVHQVLKTLTLFYVGGGGGGGKLVN